jgi:hypothetical protein
MFPFFFVDDAETRMCFGLKAARFADGALIGFDGGLRLAGGAQDAPFDGRCFRIRGATDARRVDFGERALVDRSNREERVPARRAQREIWHERRARGGKVRQIVGALHRSMLCRARLRPVEKGVRLDRSCA